MPFLVDLFGAIALLVLFAFSYARLFYNTFYLLSCCCLRRVLIQLRLCVCLPTHGYRSITLWTNQNFQNVFRSLIESFLPLFTNISARNRIDCFSPLSTLNFNNCRFFFVCPQRFFALAYVSARKLVHK